MYTRTQIYNMQWTADCHHKYVHNSTKPSLFYELQKCIWYLLSATERKGIQAYSRLNLREPVSIFVWARIYV